MIFFFAFPIAIACLIFAGCPRQTAFSEKCTDPLQVRLYINNGQGFGGFRNESSFDHSSQTMAWPRVDRAVQSVMS